MLEQLVNCFIEFAPSNSIDEAVDELFQYLVMFAKKKKDVNSGTRCVNYLFLFERHFFIYISAHPPSNFNEAMFLLQIPISFNEAADELFQHPFLKEMHRT